MSITCWSLLLLLLCVVTAQNTLIQDFHYEGTGMLIATSVPSGFHHIIRNDTYKEYYKGTRYMGELPGPIEDVRGVYKFFVQQVKIPITKMFNDVRDPKATDVFLEMKKLFSLDSTFHIIYYSGHGDTTGDWMFIDYERNSYETISFDQVYTLWKQTKRGQNQTLVIITDSCYSGKWVEKARGLLDVIVQASCGPNQLAMDSNYGGVFTQRWLRSDHRCSQGGEQNRFKEWFKEWRVRVVKQAIGMLPERLRTFAANKTTPMLSHEDEDGKLILPIGNCIKLCSSWKCIFK